LGITIRFFLRSATAFPSVPLLRICARRSAALPKGQFPN